MDIRQFYGDKNEKPLDRIVSDGGFCAIFRTIGCIGDSLSSGEFESLSEEGIKGYHDFYEYSWGQYMARTLGSKVYNFSCGGMTAKGFINDFYAKCGAFKYENLCQCYIIALGVNDINQNWEIGKASDISAERKAPDDETIIGYYAEIVRKLRRKQPGAKIFLMTLPKSSIQEKERAEKYDVLSEEIRGLANIFKNTYILDFNKYAPDYDQEFHDNFFHGHMTPTGYLLTAKMVMSYIDYIIRNNPDDFKEVGFIGTPYKYSR